MLPSLINVPVPANAYYWLAYNTNGTSGNSNNLRYDSGGVEAWVTPVSLGTWPGTFGTPSGTCTANLSVYATVHTWNTVPINATVSANTYYWLAYNTNGSNGNSNNLRYDSGGLEAWITPESFGTWPHTFGTPSGTEAVNLSIYTDFQ